MNEHIILGAMSFQNSPCSNEPCRQWRNKDVLEGHFHIIIFWNMASNRWRYTDECNWMVKRCTPQRLTVEQCCTWRTISYYHPLKHGYRQMPSQLHWMNVGKAPTLKTDCGTTCFEVRWALHCMSMSDKSSIIDEAETFFSQIWLEELKGIYYEEHWAYNHWASILQAMRCMTGWLNEFQEGWW